MIKDNEIRLAYRTVNGPGSGELLNGAAFPAKGYGR
jgi:hypothetical protein